MICKKRVPEIYIGIPLKLWLLCSCIHRSIPLETSEEQRLRKEWFLGSYKMNKSQNSQRDENTLISPQKDNTLEVELNQLCNNGYSVLAIIKHKNKSWKCQLIPNNLNVCQNKVYHSLKKYNKIWCIATENLQCPALNKNN